MKPKQIAQVTPFLMDGYLLVAFDQKWIEVCNGFPTFAVIIDKDGRLNLLGPIVAKKMEVAKK